MNWELIGNLLLCLVIVSVPVLFAVVNANYIPEDKKRE